MKSGPVLVHLAVHFYRGDRAKSNTDFYDLNRRLALKFERALCYFVLSSSTIPQGREVDGELTSRVLQHSLKQHRVLCYPLGDEQDALRDTQPPHNGAAHLFLGKTNKSTLVRTHKKGTVDELCLFFLFFWSSLKSRLMVKDDRSCAGDNPSCLRVKAGDAPRRLPVYRRDTWRQTHIHPHTSREPRVARL